VRQAVAGQQKELYEVGGGGANGGRQKSGACGMASWLQAGPHIHLAARTGVAPDSPGGGQTLTRTMARDDDLDDDIQFPGVSGGSQGAPRGFQTLLTQAGTPHRRRRRGRGRRRREGQGREQGRAGPGSGAGFANAASLGACSCWERGTLPRLWHLGQLLAIRSRAAAAATARGRRRAPGSRGLLGE